MNRPHKYAGIKLAATTNLDRAVIANTAQAAASEARGNAWNSPGRVRFEKASANRLDFSVRTAAPLNRELMTFALTITAKEAQSSLVVQIVSYKTAQQKIFGFIPVAPTKLLGVAAYRSFLQYFGNEIKRADSAATVHMTEM